MAVSSRAGTRPPAAAGRFYPARGEALGYLVDDLLDAVAVPHHDHLAAGYVVPHAGYVHSGPTAAHVFARLRRHAGQLSRIVLIGPSHHLAVTGCVVGTASAWRTPLGNVPVDVATVATLVADGHVVTDDRPFEPEHSLEVQLPFLQRAQLHPAAVVPLIVGDATPAEVAATVAAAVLAAGPGTVVLCSTDLSHHQPQAVAAFHDARTAEAVVQLQGERIGLRDACGVFALRGLLHWARDAGLRGIELHRSTSARTAGDPDRVVGYGAFALARQR